jgi:mRNA-degrading endonuclease YafQ of YafQ-DinJ toxin-antitoxin module
MRAIVWSAPATREFRRYLRRHPELAGKLQRVLQQLVDDPFDPALRTHKLRGDLAGVWCCSLTYEYRILFDLVPNPETETADIFPLAVGSHDELY